MPHGYCYLWLPEITWLHVTADALIALAYFSIPVMLFIFANRRKDMPFRMLFMLFAAFIILCGLTHLFSIYVLWHPYYGIQGLLKLATGLVSVFTAFTVWKIMPVALKLPSPAALQKMNTDLKSQAKKLQMANAKIQKQADEQEVLVEKLVKSNEELERFAYVASHDLQEPLRTMRNFSGLLAQELADTKNEKIQTYLGVCSESAARMQDLVYDLLEYSRLLDDQPSHEDVDGNEALEFALKNLADTISDKNAIITYDDLPNISGSPVRFARVLQNLIANGIKYQNDGAVPEVGIKVNQQGDFWQFIISDNGIGIDKKYFNRIFEPFKRLHTNDQYTGTGLGLAISRKVIEQMGGKMWVESEKGRGTDMIFTVPVNSR